MKEEGSEECGKVNSSPAEAGASGAKMKGERLKGEGVRREVMSEGSDK